MAKAGLRYKQLRTVWGKVEMPKQGYHCPTCFYDERQFVERGIDTSGVLPEALRRSIKLVSKVDFAEAYELLNDWGLALSKSSLGCVDILTRSDDRKGYENSKIRKKAVAQNQEVYREASECLCWQ